jgi:hypothetical protein
MNRNERNFDFFSSILQKISAKKKKKKLPRAEQKKKKPRKKVKNGEKRAEKKEKQVEICPEKAPKISGVRFFIIFRLNLRYFMVLSIYFVFLFFVFELFFFFNSKKKKKNSPPSIESESPFKK